MNDLLKQYQEQVNYETFETFSFYDVYEVTTGSSFTPAKYCCGCIILLACAANTGLCG